MPAVRSVPIRDPENNSVIGQYFESSHEFLGNLDKNYVEMSKGTQKIRANRKLISHYVDKGFEVVTPKRKDAN